MLSSGCLDSVPLGSSTKEEVSAPPALPVQRVLVDAKSRRLPVTIIGRSHDTITFVRRSDGGRFTYRITDLSKSDQEFVATLPIVVAPLDPKVTATERTDRSRGPLGFAMDERAAIQKRIALVEADLAKFRNTPTKARSLERQRAKLTNELEAVETNIRLLQSQNGIAKPILYTR